MVQYIWCLSEFTLLFDKSSVIAWGQCCGYGGSAVVFEVNTMNHCDKTLLFLNFNGKKRCHI